MKKLMLVRNFASISALLLTVQSIAVPAFGDQSAAAYKEQMRAYHAKLLAYQVQPGRMLEQRQQLCQRLKEFTRADQNVDALWAKFDALERRARGTDSSYANDCNALLAEVKTRAESSKQQDSDSKNTGGAAAANQSADKSRSDAAIADFFRDSAPRSGPQLNRRKRIFEELKRCHQQKKEIANHVQQYLQMDNALLSGSSSLNDLCTKLEDNLALPHNIKD